MSTTFTTSQRRETSLSTTLRKEPIAAATLRLDTALPTSIEAQFTLANFDTAVSIPSATATTTSISPNPTSSVHRSVGTCSAGNDCATEATCPDGKCDGVNDTAPFGAGSGSTSHLNTASAIGIGVAAVALIALLIGIGIWFWRVRGKRQPIESIESPFTNHHRSASNATRWTIDNDQKTLVASLPNSPHNAGFREQQQMAPGIFAKVAEFNESGRENKKQGSVVTEKTLPLRPLPETPLPPTPTEQRRYALNVNINKSIIFDEEMVRAVSPHRDSGTPRERVPRYRFEEYLPPVARTPSISITPVRPDSKQRSSEYELERFPNKKLVSGTTSPKDDVPREGTLPVDQREITLSELEGKPPLLPLPDLPPPSPGLSFRSYDWYQDIIGDRQSAEPTTPTFPNGNSARTPTQATFPAPQSLSLTVLEVDSSLVPAPLSPSAPPYTATSNPEPVPATPLSSTAPNFQLPPTVYQRPPVRSNSPPAPPNAARVSVLSTMTRKTHNSRSWLPDDGFYLPEEGTMDSWKRIRRPSDPSRPTTYSPLS